MKKKKVSNGLKKSDEMKKKGFKSPFQKIQLFRVATVRSRGGHVAVARLGAAAHVFDALRVRRGVSLHVTGGGGLVQALKLKLKTSL